MTALAPTPAYKITKAALSMLTVQYALSLKSEGFVVVAMSPGVSDLSCRADYLVGEDCTWWRRRCPLDCLRGGECSL